MHGYGAVSKGSRAYHSATCESSCFLAISHKCFIFLEFWMTAFHFRPCKSRAKFKQLNTEGYRSGHNGADSKGSRAYHSRERKILRFLRLSRKCFIFLEFWMNAFHHRPCKSRAKFELNLIRRRIEVVITGLTRKVADLVTCECAKALVFSDYLGASACAWAMLTFFLNFE